MMNSIYCTNCYIKAGTGDGIVSYNEVVSLSGVSDSVSVLQADALRRFNPLNDVWLQDFFAGAMVRNEMKNKTVDLCHVYGGPYATLFEHIQGRGATAIVTMPAHDRKLSISEHEVWYGEGSYPFRHISDDYLWNIYTEHVRMADVVIAPSTNSKKNIMHDMRVSDKKIVIIPHGCDLPSHTAPLPDDFSVAYLSQIGADKGTLYLMTAWMILNYPDVVLTMAGAGTEQLSGFIIRPGAKEKGKFRLLGRVDNPSDVYENCSVFVLPSVNEGFGITALEAMAHGRAVIVGEGAGSHDVVTDGEDGFVVPIRDPEAIADKIDWFRNNPREVKRMGENARIKAEQYSWDNVREMYMEVYKNARA